MTIPKSEQHMTRQRGQHQKAKENRTKLLKAEQQESYPILSFFF